MFEYLIKRGLVGPFHACVTKTQLVKSTKPLTDTHFKLMVPAMALDAFEQDRADECFNGLDKTLFVMNVTGPRIAIAVTAKHVDVLTAGQLPEHIEPFTPCIVYGLNDPGKYRFASRRTEDNHRSTMVKISDAENKGERGQRCGGITCHSDIDVHYRGVRRGKYLCYHCAADSVTLYESRNNVVEFNAYVLDIPGIKKVKTKKPTAKLETGMEYHND